MKTARRQFAYGTLIITLHLVLVVGQNVLCDVLGGMQSVRAIARAYPCGICHTLMCSVAYFQWKC